MLNLMIYCPWVVVISVYLFVICGETFKGCDEVRWICGVSGSRVVVVATKNYEEYGSEVCLLSCGELSVNQY